MSTESKATQFLLLFRHSKEGPEPTPEELQQIFRRWVAWMKGMKARGEFAGADRLLDTGAVLRGPQGASLTDGPFVEAKEVVGGYVLINAPSLPAAIAIARGCPGLATNSTIVEVRPIEPLPAI